MVTTRPNERARFQDAVPGDIVQHDLSLFFMKTTAWCVGRSARTQLRELCKHLVCMVI